MEPLTKIFGTPSRLKALRLFVFNQNSAFTLDEVADTIKILKRCRAKRTKRTFESGLLKKKGETAHQLDIK